MKNRRALRCSCYGSPLSLPLTSRRRRIILRSACAAVPPVVRTGCIPVRTTATQNHNNTTRFPRLWRGLLLAPFCLLCLFAGELILSQPLANDPAHRDIKPLAIILTRGEQRGPGHGATLVLVGAGKLIRHTGPIVDHSEVGRASLGRKDLQPAQPWRLATAF